MCFSHRFISSATPSPPSLSKSEANLLQRLHYLRERAIDMEKRTTQALEQAGELPPPHTPLASVAPRAMRDDDDRQRAVDEAAQPSPVRDMADWLEEAMEKVEEVEEQLLAAVQNRQRTGSQESRSAMSVTELDELEDEAEQLRQERWRRRHRVNDEVQQEEEEQEEVRLGPVPVVTGPEEPVWLAVPLRGEGEEGEQRAEEQQAVGPNLQQQDSNEAAGKDDQHIHRQLPEDRPTGTPEKETGGVSTPQDTQHSTGQQPHMRTTSGYFCLIICAHAWLTDRSNQEGGRIPSTNHSWQRQRFTSSPSVAAMNGSLVYHKMGCAKL